MKVTALGGTTAPVFVTVFVCPNRYMDATWVVSRCTGIIYAIAKKLSNRLPESDKSTTWEDLASVGMAAAINGLRDYDWRVSGSRAGFLVARARMAMLNEIRELQFGSAYFIKERRSFLAKIDKARAELGDSCCNSEIAVTAGMGPSEFFALERAAEEAVPERISIEECEDSTSGEDCDGVDSMMEKALMRVRMDRAWKILSPSEEKVIRHHVIYGRSLTEVGDMLEITKQRAFTIKTNALRKLRKFCGGEDG